MRTRAREQRALHSEGVFEKLFAPTPEWPITGEVAVVERFSHQAQFVAGQLGTVERDAPVRHCLYHRWNHSPIDWVLNPQRWKSR